MKYSEVKKLLKRMAAIWITRDQNTRCGTAQSQASFPVGRHNGEDCPKGTLNANLKNAGLI